MKRSSDVTAAAIVMLAPTPLLAIMWMAIAARAFENSLLLGVPLLWVIITAVGILKLRPWARISAVALSVALISFGAAWLLVGVLGPLLLKNSPHTTAWIVATTARSMLVGIWAPLAIPIWWLVLFTRRRVALEFASRSSAPPAAGATP